MKKYFLSYPLYLKLHRIFQFLNRNKTIILMYHGFTDEEFHEGIENYQGKHIYIGLFRSQIEYIVRNYNVISLNEYITYCEMKEKLPPKSIILTIDDGYKSNYTLAYPVFKEFDIPATIFLTTDFIDNKNHLWVDRLEYAVNKTKKKNLKLKIADKKEFFDIDTYSGKIICDKSIRHKLKSMNDAIIGKIIHEVENKLEVKLSETVNMPPIYEPLEWDQISKMINTSKIDIGSHTHKHLLLANYDIEVIENELSLSKKIIERKTGINTELFCYPNGAVGDFNKKTKIAIKESGYSCALTTV
ncbi:MAG: polysaccharide deacetylase family protein, partial [Asgard group archaeon]|nr:polysaccharide deacetylase family protein [Asgard group archaeon]